ncbi:MAG: hypothetical protein DWQ40_00395 [Actinobacteria bacterium]|nr:MAG: hypothetical protein DWQ40_00395 [Actinomycetota bacterium]REK35571.1 MAG: hypothetical protein DWQ20_05990 [Actinomycetota bacterium]
MPQVERPKEDTIDGAINGSATSVDVDNPDLWARGDILEFASTADTAGEQVIVDGVSGSTLTIRRAYNGTTAASQSDGAVVRKNPDFSELDINDLINEVVDMELADHVWSWHSGTITYSQATETYALPAYIYDVWRIFQYDLNGEAGYHDLPETAWQVKQQMPTAIVANEYSVHLRQDAVYDPSDTVYYTGLRRPNSADLANLDTRLEPLIVWGVLGKAAPRLRAFGLRRNPPRQDTSRSADTSDVYRLGMQEFLRLRTSHEKVLRSEVQQPKRFVPRQRRRRI